MSLRVLELGRFSLANAVEALKLEVVSAADFRGPQSISELDDDALVKAVTSRQLWVSRGRGCRIDIEILLDGKTLNRNFYFQLLETLGCLIRDAKAWNQLCLSTSLELLPDVPFERLPHLSIHLINSTKPPEHEGGLAAWIGNIDVNPPPGVVRAELERLQIQFNFITIQEPHLIKWPEPSPLRPESPDIMLLDLPVDTAPKQEADSQNLEQAVEILKGLPSQVKSCFGPLEPVLSDDGLLLDDPFADIDFKIHANDRSMAAPTSHGGKESKGRKKLPEKAVAVLDAWVATRRDNLYPTMEEKEKLMVDTGLNRSQLNSELKWYRRNRKIVWASEVAMESEVEMLLDNLYGTTKTDDRCWEENRLLNNDIGHTGMEEYNDDKMLFSQISNGTTPRLSQSSAVSATTSTDSTIPSTGSNGASLLQTSLRWGSSPITIATPCALADVAFRTLMGAVVTRRGSRLQDLQYKNRPQVSMSTFVPSMFSFGFKNSITGHSRFLPTIGNALSISMVQNVQTPSLRRKLLQLSNLEPSKIADSGNEVGSPGTIERLSSVVQSKLWTMMQRKLFEKSAGPRLWRQSREGNEDVEEDFEDMLAAVGDGPHLKIDEDDEMSDEEMLFADDEDDDLLLRDDNDYYNADWERRTIEDDTEDMLLGDEWQQHWADDQEEMLLDDSRNGIDTTEGNSTILLLGESDNEEMLLDGKNNGTLKNLDVGSSLLLLDESENEAMLI